MKSSNYRLPAFFFVVLLITSSIVPFVKGTKSLGGNSGLETLPALQLDHVLQEDPEILGSE